MGVGKDIRPYGGRVLENTLIEKGRQAWTPAQFACQHSCTGRRWLPILQGILPIPHMATSKEMFLSYSVKGMVARGSQDEEIYLIFMRRGMESTGESLERKTKDIVYSVRSQVYTQQLNQYTLGISFVQNIVRHWQKMAR